VVAAEEGAAAAAVKENVVYDMRKVISERLRTESAANIARAAAAESWSKSNRDRAERATQETDKVQLALAATAGSAGATQTAAAIAAKEAALDAAGARRALAQAQADAKVAGDQAAAMTVEGIPAAVAAAAKEEAEAKAVLYGWDKPPNWDKVIALTSADKYLKQMSKAIWRAAEYNGYARGILGKAAGARKKATAIARQANQYEALGDLSQAKFLRFQIKGLIGSSKGLEAKAKKFWQVADDAQKSVGEWQQAGMLAANYKGWEFHQYFTPPPSLLQEAMSVQPS